MGLCTEIRDDFDPLDSQAAVARDPAGLADRP
jgi:hypothetical protein